MAAVQVLTVRIGAQISEALEAFDSLALKSKKLGEDLSRVGRSLTTHVTLPVTALGAGVLKVAGDFEKSMNRVEALSGATGDQFEALREQAKELGATTQFSASQAADAMGFLAMAGFEATEIMGAMPSTLQLAAAAQMDLATAADITSNILTGYSMSVDELGHANDVLVKAFTSANTDLSQLGEAMKYAGPIASGLGIQFEEAAAAIGLFGNAGIQGSMAGTSLRGALTRLAKPTAEVSATLEKLEVHTHDSTGAMLPLVDIVRQLEDTGASAADMMALFGQRAGPAMMALVEQGSDALSEFTATLEGSGGTAQEVAEAQMKGLQGAILELKSAVEGMAIAIADSGLIDFVTDIVRSAGEWMRGVNELNPEILKWGTIIAGVAAAIGPVLVVVGKLLTLLPLLKAGFLVLTGPIGWFIGAAAALTVAWVKWGDDIKRIVGDTVAVAKEWLVDRFGPLFDAVSGYLSATMEMWKAFGKLVLAIVTEYLLPPWQPVIALLKEVGGAFVWLGEKAWEMMKWMVDKITGLFTGPLSKAFDIATGAIDKVTGAFQWMYDAVVGNSYVPDMVDGIGREFGRLHLEMVEPTVAATEATSEAFEDAAERGAEAWDNFGSQLGMIASRGTEAIADFAMGSRDAIRSFVDDALRQLARLATSKLFKTVFSAIVPGGGLLGSIFGGFFADGGFLEPGKIGIVGEEGPELIVGGRSGVTVQPLQSRPAMAAAGASGPSAGSIAEEILARVGPPPAFVSPEVAATSDYYRRLLGALIQDGRHRGVLA